MLGLARIEFLHPDVVLLDCRMPGMAGAEVAAAVRRRGLPTRVLALSAYANNPYVRGMLEGGAMGYLLKSEAPETIAEAVRAVMRGECYFSPAVAAQIAAWARREMSLPGTLTAREREVLRLLAQGLNNKEIARGLGISEKTVEKHLHGLFTKLGVASGVEVAVRAVREGLA